MCGENFFSLAKRVAKQISRSVLWKDRFFLSVRMVILENAQEGVYIIKQPAQVRVLQQKRQEIVAILISAYKTNSDKRAFIVS